MASADFCSLTKNGWQTSSGKNIRFPFMQPEHLRSGSRYSIGLLFHVQHHPNQIRLLCTFCSSAQTFALRFLQIPPRDGHPCDRLRLPTVKRLRDLHPIAYSHAPHTEESPVRRHGNGAKVGGLIKLRERELTDRTKTKKATGEGGLFSLYMRKTNL